MSFEKRFVKNVSSNELKLNHKPEAYFIVSFLIQDILSKPLSPILLIILTGKILFEKRFVKNVVPVIIFCTSNARELE